MTDYKIDHSSEGSRERKVHTPSINYAGGHEIDVHEDDSHALHRGLSARQITMIAIGGAIGTGLIIGT